VYRGNKGINRRKSSRTHNKSNTFTNDNDQLVSQEMCDQTIIPNSGENVGELERAASGDPDAQEVSLRDRLGSVASIASEIAMETVFPAPDLILNELFQSYKSKNNLNERNFAILDYIRLIFQNIK